MEIHLLAIQARILAAAAVCFLAVGLFCGTDPQTLAWRAGIAAWVTAVAGGWLARQVAAVIEERISQDESERLMASQKNEPKSEPAVPVRKPEPPVRRPVTPAAPGRGGPSR